jgi:hypothetical protein
MAIDPIPYTSLSCRPSLIFRPIVLERVSRLAGFRLIVWASGPNTVSSPVFRQPEPSGGRRKVPVGLVEAEKRASDNNEGNDLKHVEILRRAVDCIDKLPDRKISAESQKAYRQTFARMLREPTLDALLRGIALDTFYHRRAALHWCSRWVLERFRGKWDAAVSRNDVAAAKSIVGVLARLLNRIEPALELDPPLEGGASALQSPASRWKAATGPHPERGAKGKRHVLGSLPPKWDEKVWQTGLEVWTDPSDQRELDALALRFLVPIRSEDLMPGERAHGWSEGVSVKLCSPHRLEVTIAPAKSHGGRYGTGITVVKINPVEAGGPAAYLAARCAGGRTVVSLASKDASRKKLLRLGKIALPDCDVNITPYVCRNQVIADYKVTLGAGVAVAAAAGHCTDRTQAKYGYVQNGRRRRGLIGVASQMAPRTGNIARARELGKSARHAPAGPPPVAPVEPLGASLKSNNAKNLTQRTLLGSAAAASYVATLEDQVRPAIVVDLSRSESSEQDKNLLADAVLGDGARVGDKIYETSTSAIRQHENPVRRVQGLQGDVDDTTELGSEHAVDRGLDQTQSVQAYLSRSR